MAKVRRLPQRLDDFSKILVATGQINYMAASINGVNEQIKMTGLAEDKIHSGGVKDRDKLLKEVVNDLAAVMGKMGNLINAQDCICPIDQRVSKVPFEIIIQRMDEVESLYQDDDQ